MGEGTGKRKKTLKNKAPSFNNTTDNLDSSNSDKKMKKVAKTKKRKSTEFPEAETTEIAVSSILNEVDEVKNSASKSAKKKSKLNKKKIERENKKDRLDEYALRSNKVEDDFNPQSADYLDCIASDKKMKKHARKKKRKGTELPEAETTEIVSTTPDDVNESKNSDRKSDKKKNKLKEKKRDRTNRKKVGAREYVPHSNEVGDVTNQQNGKSKSVFEIGNDATLLNDEDEVYQISSGDEDETTGMRRWIEKYHRARPGPEVLSQNIDLFFVDYWAEKEKEKKQREDEAAEGGWTVVTHIKGRKKTTDAESGTTVGSVAQAAMMDKMSKKKKKKEQVGIDFYRFQRREAQRNEIMTLQSKFEQDKKRIQQLRAARKFRPY